MRRRTHSGKSTVSVLPSTAELFAKLLFERIPPRVAERLQTLHAALAEHPPGPDGVGEDALREALARLSTDLPVELAHWNHAFAAAMAHAGEAGFGERLRRLPDPPPEPPGFWDRLLTLAEQPDDTGTAACLILYDLGCARAFRAFTDQP